LLFSSLLFAFVLFVNFFGFLMWEHTSLFILSKKKKQKKVLCERLRSGK
jgi:hypothetical protein